MDQIRNTLTIGHLRGAAGDLIKGLLVQEQNPDYPIQEVTQGQLAQRLTAWAIEKYQSDETPLIKKLAIPGILALGLCVLPPKGLASMFTKGYISNLNIYFASSIATVLLFGSNMERIKEGAAVNTALRNLDKKTTRLFFQCKLHTIFSTKECSALWKNKISMGKIAAHSTVKMVASKVFAICKISSKLGKMNYYVTSSVIEYFLNSGARAAKLQSPESRAISAATISCVCAIATTVLLSKVVGVPIEFNWTIIAFDGATTAILTWASQSEKSPLCTRPKKPSSRTHSATHARAQGNQRFANRIGKGRRQTQSL